MFTPAKATNKTPRQQADIFFLLLSDSGTLANQSNEILNLGRKLLARSAQLTKNEFDKIVIGTLLLALVRHDCKYRRMHLNEETYEQIRKEIGLPLNPNHISAGYTKQHILLTGKKVLEDKTISFNGTFSQVKDVQEKIEKGLPFMNSKYLETYDIIPPRVGIRC